jgi:glycosyltransferase involved in cell wall biosynthesis
MTSPAPLRFGYLVPEFPGQTHVFFQREIEALERGGAAVDLLSTTPPDAAVMSHPWTVPATARTTYLGRPGMAETRDAVTVLGRAAIARRLMPAVRRAAGGSRVEQLKVLLAAAALAGRARRLGWTHVHVHSCGNSARVAVVAAALAPVTYSLTLHGPLADYGPQQREKWRHAAFGLVITERLRAEIARDLGADVAEHTARAPMGIRLADTERDAPYVPWQGVGDALVFSCGRLNIAKGHHVLIRAVSILAGEGLPVHLSIAGEDEAGGRGFRLDLEDLIADLGLTGRVTLLGAVGEDVVRDHLHRAHVFALASRGEPLGVAIMEAMGAALPVVVGDGGGVRELVEDGTGVLVEPGDPLAVANAIRSILHSADSARAMGARARAHVRQHFTSDASAAVLARSIRATSSVIGGAS